MISRGKKYVKLKPTKYDVDVVLKMKDKSKIPITAHYKNNKVSATTTTMMV